MNAVLTKSERMDWRTPRTVLDRSERALGGPIDCDPCASSYPAHWFAANMNHTKEDDGLVRQWGKRNFVNPEYGRSLPRWMTSG